MTRNFAELGSIAQFINGAAFKPEDWGEQGKQIIRIQNLTDPTKPFNRTNRKVADQLHVHRGDLLVSWSASLGVFEWNEPESALLNQHIFRVLPDQARVEKRYLRHGLERALLEMQRHLHGATMQHVNRGEFLSTKLYLPPLPEQRRIAEVLDGAEALRAKRRAALTQLDTLTQSIFLDMFGDPVTNSKAWKCVEMSDTVVGKYGIKAGPFGSSLKKVDYVASGYRIYGQEQVIAGNFNIGDYYVGERKYLQLKSCAVAEGDLLVSLVGSFGKVLIVPAGIEPGIINPRLLKITPNQAMVTPYFLAALLQHSSFQAEFRRVAHGGTMGILNAGLLKQLKVILPSTTLQHEFSRRIASIEKVKTIHVSSLSRLDTLFASLQHRAFQGEL